MAAVNELDLSGVLLPVCLLKCKTMLQTLRSGQVMRVIVQDPETADSIVKIIERSADRVIGREQDGGRYRVTLQKGTPD